MSHIARRLFAALAGVASLASLSLAAAPAAAQVPYSQLDQTPQSPAGLSAQAKYAAIVVDANSGEVLYAKRADSPRYPASVTKVMTMYLAFEALSTGKIKATDLLTVSPRAAAQAPTKLGIPAGSTISLDDALRSLATKSANDMAVAVAERLGGSEQRFAALMTLRAQELGMTTTRFVNASGLPDSRQISSARDLAILSRAVMRDYPQYYSYFSQRSFTYRGQTMRNHNNLLAKMPGVDGLKTGFTNASGYNLAASAVRDGRRLIAVVMGGTSGSARDTNVATLLETGFQIMRRRDRGEQITVAQTLFEPYGASAVAGAPEPSLAQGDGGRELGNGWRMAGNGWLNAPGARQRTPAGAEQSTPRAAQTPIAVAARSKPPVQAKVAADADDVRLTRQAIAADKAKSLKVDPKLTKAELAKAEAADRKKLADAKEAAGKGKGKDGKGKDAKSAKAAYAVQVGSFKSRGDAKDQLALISKRYGQLLGDATGTVDTAVKGAFKAQFTGLTATAAKEACSLLKAKRQVCLVLGG